MKIFSVSYALLIGTVPAQGMQTQNVLFSSFPTTADVADNAPSEAYKEMVANLEVPEVQDYIDTVESEGFVQFECFDEDGLLGIVLIEEVEVLDPSTN